MLVIIILSISHDSSVILSMSS